MIFNNLREIIDQTIKSQKKIILLSGEIGSGKTTFVKEFAKIIGIKQNISSPTFNIMKIYENLIHIDAYRIKGDLSEFEDYFENNYVIIEWPENLNLNFKSYIHIEIKFKNEDRIYEVIKNV